MYTVEFSFDFNVGIDPYRRSTGGHTVPSAYLWIDDDRKAIRVIVEQANPGETGYSPDDLLTVPLEYGGDNYGETWTPDPDAFEALMRSPEANALMQRIAEGYSQDWPNPQRPGDGFKRAYLDDDGEDALTELNALIAALSVDSRDAWNSEDWFASALSTAHTTADEIDSMIADPTGSDDSIYLTDDHRTYLMDWFSQVLDSELHMQTVSGNLLHHRGAAILVRRDEDGDIEQVVEIVTPAGNRWGAPDPDDLITQNEVTKLFEVSAQVVSNAIRDGRLHGYRLDNAPRHRPGGVRVSLAEARKLWGEG